MSEMCFHGIHSMIPHKHKCRSLSCILMSCRIKPDSFGVSFCSQLTQRQLVMLLLCRGNTSHQVDAILFIGPGMQTAGNESKLNRCCEWQKHYGPRIGRQEPQLSKRKKGRGKKKKKQIRGFVAQSH